MLRVSSPGVAGRKAVVNDSISLDPARRAWNPDGTIFDWLPREAMQRIEKELELGAAGTAKLVYLALCRIANKEESAVFTKPINYIATLASVGRKTVERRLPDLERLNLVSIDRRKIAGTNANDSNTYTLATLRRKVASLSHNLATGTRLPAVAVKKEQKNGRTGFKKPRTIPDRIAAENQLKILKSRLDDLTADTSEQWQRDEHPELVTEKQNVRAEITALENSLLP